MSEALAIPEPSGLTRKELEDTLAQVLGHFAQRMGEVLQGHSRHVAELSGVVREFGQETRGVLLEFAKFKQLHRVQAELAWLDGVHGRQAMAEFKEAIGMTKWEGLMREQIKSLEDKRGTPALPEGVGLAPRYTWWCDKCPDTLQGPQFATQAEATEDRAQHVKAHHPELTEGPVVEALN